MKESLDWLEQVVFEPVNEGTAPGQLDLGLVVERVWDRCLCGGAVSVDLDGDVAEAVARHRMTSRHREWGILGGLGLPVRPEDFGHIPVTDRDINTLSTVDERGIPTYQHEIRAKLLR